jgi:hypothetical protein
LPITVIGPCGRQSTRWLALVNNGPKGIAAKSELANLCSGVAEQAKTIVMIEQNVAVALSFVVASSTTDTFFQGKPSSRIKSGKLFDIILGRLCPAKA